MHKYADYYTSHIIVKLAREKWHIKYNILRNAFHKNQGTYTENIKRFMKKIKEDIWHNKSCLWIGGLNIVQM